MEKKNTTNFQHLAEKKQKTDYSHEMCQDLFSLLADDSHEMSWLVFSKK